MRFSYCPERHPDADLACDDEPLQSADFYRAKNVQIEARQDPMTLLRTARICARKGGAWENQRYGALLQRVVSPVFLP
jgi:hypothetical protein